MDNKFYFFDRCPYCKEYRIVEVGYSNSANQILKCDCCQRIFLEKDIDKIRKELDENNKLGKPNN